MTRTGPLVTVVMPAYKVGRFIGAALDSVAAQVYPNWEVVVVDDHGPDDGMQAVVRAFAARHADHRVELIRHEVNQGVSAARNTAIHAGRGELLAFLDPDDLWYPEHLSLAVEAFARDPHLQVTSGPVLVQEEVPGRSGTWTTARERWHRRYFPHSLSVYNYLQPSATVVRRATVLDVGGFDTDPRIQHIEDYDLWIRLVERGGSFHFHERPTSVYRRHEGGATADVERMRARDAFLFGKHAEFFRRESSILHLRMLADMEALDDRSQALAQAQQGPLMRAIIACDGVLRRWRRLFRSGRAGH